MKLPSNDLELVKEVFVFCPNCATKFNNSDESSKTCPNCELHFYINPSPTAGAILINEIGEILLVKRRVDPGKGLWDVPGGFVDLNENLEDSLNRELKEELGIDSREFKYLGSKVDIYKYSNRYQQTLGTIFEGKVSSKENLKASDDISGYKFFTKDNFPIDKIAFKSLEEFFRRYLNLDNKG